MNDKLKYLCLRAADSLLSGVVLAGVLVLFAYGSYALWDTMVVLEQASPVVYEEYKPKTDDTLSFESLTALNPEVLGWVTVYGTNVDYPLVQAADNEKYLITDSQGRYSLSGGIFLDCRNSGLFTDFNSIIYGHHMAYHAMFGDIGEFREKTFFDTHPYGNLYFGGKDHGIEFFAFVETDVYLTKLYMPALTGEEKQQAYIDGIFRDALYSRPLEISPSDRLVLLSTCTEDVANGRHILVGRITDRVFENPFAAGEKEEEKKPVASIDTVLRMNGDILLILMLGILLLLLAAAAAVLTATRRQTGKGKRHKNDGGNKHGC